MAWLTTQNILIVSGFLAVPAIAAIALELAARRAHRRSVERWHRHMRSGGWLRDMIARWRRTPRLTDQRHLSERNQSR